MIDIDSQVFHKVYEEVTAQYANAFVTGEYVKAPPSFPCVSVVEMDNHTDLSTYAGDAGETHATVTYEVSTYSNKATGKKSECRAIAAVVDNLFNRLGFVRISLAPVPNLLDATTYRIVGRYRALVSTNEIIYRR